MLYAEQQVGRRLTQTFEWSPRLKVAVMPQRYWVLRLCLKRHPTRKTSLEKIVEDNYIPEEQHKASLIEQELVHNLRESYATLRQYQSHHKELRETHLELIADAIVWDRNPALFSWAAQPIRSTRQQHQLRQLKQCDKMRKSYRKLKGVLKKLHPMGISKLDVPDNSFGNPAHGDPANPKTWTGPWKTLVNLKEISKHIMTLNIQQYHKAHCTPFGSGPLAGEMGRSGNSSSTQAVLDGKIPNSLMSAGLPPETLRLLQSLGTTQPSLHSTATISDEEFLQAYKVTPETTSSSPSGRHVGYYKAILQDSSLVNLHASMSSLPFQVGFVPDRWKKTVNIMLEKEPGNSHCHRLHIIALFQSDLNQAKQIIIGRRLSRLLEDKSITSKMQQGSLPGRQCVSAVLQKVLSHDILRLTKWSAAFIENDAIRCFDRLVNKLILMILTKLGIPISEVKCLSQLWDTTIHLIKIIYGISDNFYTTSESHPLYGPGQGLTCGLLFWLLCYWIIVTSLDTSITAARFYSTMEDIVLEITGVSFVDDNSLGVTSSYKNDPNFSMAENWDLEITTLVSFLQRLAQHWER